MNPQRRSLLGCALFPLAASLGAQERYPSRPITIVVPFPPGGVADIVARSLAPALERTLGKTVIVANKPGAGGSIGAGAVATAKADGYTLLMALASVSTNPEQERINDRPASFQLAQLTPLARISVDPMMLVVRADSPLRSFQAVVDEAKKRPDGLAYPSSGVYGVYHVATEMIAHAAGIKLRHIPYTGGAPALNALLSGEVDVGLVTASVGSPHLQSGRLRPLAAMSDQRWKAYPDTPTLAELGLDVDYTLWSGLFAPTGTPPEVLRTLDAAIATSVKDPQFVAAIDRSGGKLSVLDASRFADYWRKDSTRLIEAVRRIGKMG